MLWKIKKKRTSLLLMALVLSLVALSLTLQGCGGSGDESKQLRILWTNDTHGYFLPVYHAEFDEISSYPDTAATEGKIGGYAQIKTLADKYKAEVSNSLFLDGGDTFDGSPVAQLTRGESVIPVLNAMGYDAMVPGNRDYAYGKSDFLKVTSMIKFPVVAANLSDSTTGQFPFPRFIIKQFPGLKVAIVGLTHFSLTTTGFTAGTREQEMTDLVKMIRADHNPDLVIGISHFGYFQDQKFASRTSGFDVIVGAHTHHNIFDPPVVKSLDGRDVIVVQAGSHGKFLGKLDLQVRDRKVVSYKHELVRVISKNITPDPTVQALADAAYAPYKDLLDRVIGKTTTLIERRGDVQSTMSNFLTDAYREIYGTDVASFGGIRYGSSHIPGNITVGDVYNMVSPNIGDTIYTYGITGANLKTTISNGLNQEYGPDPYVWPGGDVARLSGAKYTYKVNAADGEHIVSMTVGGQPVDTSKTYTMASQSSPSTAINPVKSATKAVDEIVNYIVSKQVISPKLDDRTVRVD